MTGKHLGASGGNRLVWVLPLIAGSLWVLEGAVRLAMGCTPANCFGDQLPTSTPQGALTELVEFAQEIGTFNLLVGVLVVAAAWFGLKRGERWGWYVSLWFFVTTISDFGEILNPVYLLGLVLTGIALAMSYRTFFSRQPPTMFQPVDRH